METRITSEGQRVASSLADVKAQRKALAMKREERAKLREVEAEQYQLRLDELQEQYETQHPKASIVRSDREVVAVVACSGPEYQRFADEANFGLAAVHTFVRPWVVAPDPTAFDAIVGRYPGMLIDIANEIQRLAGLKRDATQAKS